MSIACDWDDRDHEDNKIAKSNEKIKAIHNIDEYDEEFKENEFWKGKKTERRKQGAEGIRAFNRKNLISGVNRKKNGELWMKNLKNCVLQE